MHFLNMLGVLAYMFLIFQSFCIPSFSDTTCHPGDVKAFVNFLFKSGWVVEAERLRGSSSPAH